MSISLPNGTLLVAPTSVNQQYTAAVTRILHLANFSPEMKTRDLQGLFRDYENEKGGFRIKWVDDVNALVVFGDAAIAKRAYLAFLLHPPQQYLGHIKPYDKSDAAQIIQSLAARSMGHRGSSSIVSNNNNNSWITNGNASGITNGYGESTISGLPNQGGHHRSMSTSSGLGVSGGGGAFGGFSIGGGGSRGRASISGPTGPGNQSQHHHQRGNSGSFPNANKPTGGSVNGVWNFNNGGAFGTGSGGVGSLGNRLPTHNESTASRSASSSDTEPVIIMDAPHPVTGSTGNTGPSGQGSGSGSGFGNWKMGATRSASISNGMGGGGHYGRSTAGGGAARRDSLSAEKALKEVEKALASVDAQS